MIVFTFFALSYLSRFITNVFLNDVDNVDISYFTFLMINLLIVLIEGTSLGTLLFFHYKNFGQADMLYSSENSSQYATIKPEEIYCYSSDSANI